MANYVCKTRTNYFRVKDEAEFRAVAARIYAGDSVQVWEKEVIDPKTGLKTKLFAFGCYAELSGVTNAADDENEDWDDSAYDEMISLLQNCVADDDAIIIFEVGSETLRYLVGTATIITAKSVKSVSLRDIAIQSAGALLGNPGWSTQDCY